MFDDIASRLDCQEGITWGRCCVAWSAYRPLLQKPAKFNVDDAEHKPDGGVFAPP
jgi:hypothetical protein